MKICDSCGGVIGRDCFNPAECRIIAAQQAVTFAPCQRCKQLQSELKEAKEEIERLNKEINKALLIMLDAPADWVAVRAARKGLEKALK